MKIIAITRAERYSPNSTARDRHIIERTMHHLCGALNAEAVFVDEDKFAHQPIDGDVFVTMARSDEALQQLDHKANNGALVVNSVESVLNCRRSVLDKLMRKKNIAMPPTTGNNGYWLKRGDGSAQQKDDVVFCRDEDELQQAQQSFQQRGITDWVVSAHMVGDVVKFYFVGDHFFSFYYPGDDGITKFGDERINGKAHHYAFSLDALQAEVQRLRSLTGLLVGGGDVVIRADGSFGIIDYNDWPSFSRCAEEAAQQAAIEIKQLFKR